MEMETKLISVICTMGRKWEKEKEEGEGKSASVKFARLRGGWGGGWKSARFRTSGRGKY